MITILTGLVLDLVLFVSYTIAPAADARGRAGGFRIDGYTSHGKGSHYVGGYVRSGPALKRR